MDGPSGGFQPETPVAGPSSLPPASPSEQALVLLGRLKREIADTLPKETTSTDEVAPTPVVLKSCSACRTAKVRCTGTPVDVPCPRCLAKRLSCEFPAQKKMGRKVRNTQTLRIQSYQRQLGRIEALLRQEHAASNASLSPAAASTSSAGTAAKALSPSADQIAASLSPLHPTEHDELWSVLTHPLRLLSLDAEGHAESPAPEATLSWQSQSLPVGNHVLDADPAYDPVAIGLLTIDDFERLHKLFLDNFQIHHHLLDFRLHTPCFIRRVSPFLATVLALTVAAFCPLSGDLIPGLERHATYLSTRIFLGGYKSVEVVTAYCLWTAWLEAPSPGGRDRTWHLLSQALTCAQELRLDQPLPEGVIQQYRSLADDAGLSADLLESNKRRVQQILFSLELTVQIQRGAIQNMLPAPGLLGAACEQLNDPFLNASDPAEDLDGSQRLAAYLHASNLGINQLTAKALAAYYDHDSTQGNGRSTQESYNATFRALFAYWQSRFSRFRHTPCIVHFNRSILLLSFSLRLGSSATAQAILDECKETAIVAAQYALDWLATEPRIGFAPNAVVSDIAYGINVLLRMSNRGPQGPPLDAATQGLCRQVAGMLAMIGAARFNGRSLASSYAERIDGILETFGSPPHTFPSEPPCIGLGNAGPTAFNLASPSIIDATDFGPDSFLYPTLFATVQSMPWLAGQAPGG